VKTNCTAKVKIGNGLPTAKSVTSEIVQANKVNDPTYSTKLQASLAKKPESGAKPADEEVEAEALSGHGRKLASIVSAGRGWCAARRRGGGAGAEACAAAPQLHGALPLQQIAAACAGRSVLRGVRARPGAC
jgi:hypothetical protein